ncbi:MAG TPA: nucleotide sugar dehydrogenase [Polyangiaceae bacterium]|nr:nucleotide sugar dehydrogenase [Polyangiaceae bacterium]
MLDRLLERISTKSAHVVVLGVGYVGLPLAVEFARAGYRVTGLDPDGEKVARLNAGDSYIADVEPADVASQVDAGRLCATADGRVLAEAEAVIVCVPTPLNKTKDPDMRFIVAAADEVARYQRAGMLIILESTTYPGTTREVLVPKLTADRFVLGSDVFIAFSPERVDPGNKTFKTKNTPKVLGGATPACLGAAQALYGQIIDQVVPVSNPETAEMVKLLENTFRAVNIGLVNEIAIMSRRLGVDPFEVIRAAATKPFGFMPFYPGPGLGGHCIPIDPLHLSWKLRSLKYQARFIDLADAINSAMPAYVVDRIVDALNQHGKPVYGSKILVYGVAYKRDVSDVRESPAFDVIIELRKRSALIVYMDPHVPSVSIEGAELVSEAPSTDFGIFDVVVLITDHTALDRERLLREARLVVDTRDALRGIPGDRTKVIGL